MKLWSRICVDLTAAGNVLGLSREWHDADGPVRTTVVAPEPFESPAEAFERCRRLLPEGGEQLALL